MISAAAAGITPDVFWCLTLGEVVIGIEGYHERERQSLIGRVNAILRALQKKGDPYKGLGVNRGRKQMSWGAALMQWIWAPEDEE